MSNQINIDKKKTILFMGSMNAMPMAYAYQLKKLGYKVLYFVDASKKNALCRPEMHYPDISYPYPHWIIEFRLPSQLLLSVFPRLFSLLYFLLIKYYYKHDVGCIFLNGFFITLTPYINFKANKIALSHGSDLDVWANLDKINEVKAGMSNRSIFKYMPRIVIDPLIELIIERQLKGLLNSSAVLYFPKNFNADGDKVISTITNAGIRYIQRYDASFLQLEKISKSKIKVEQKLVILSVVRFLYKTFPEGNFDYNKGNNIIIEGLAKYYAINKNIIIHFVNKGEDVIHAKKMCDELGLGEAVMWHEEMPFNELTDYMQSADVCIDQVGTHWIGAGVYAMWLGKPLIANADRAVEVGVWPTENPVCNSRTPDQICEALMMLENSHYRNKIGIESHEFVKKNMDVMQTLNQVFDFKIK